MNRYIEALGENIERGEHVGFSTKKPLYRSFSKPKE